MSQQQSKSGFSVVNSESEMKQASLNDKAIIAAVKVVRSGRSIIVPPDITLKQARQVLSRVEQEEEELMSLKEEIDCFVWDGALAMRKAMERMYGFSLTQPIKTFFGDILPAEITIATGVSTTTTIPWGRMRWPAAEKLDGETSKEFLETGTGQTQDGRMTFVIGGQIKRKWLPEFKKFAALVREIVEKESIYKGQAISIAFSNDEGEMANLPQPEFMDLRQVNIDDLVYTRELTNIIDTYIMTPLRYSEECRRAGIPLKRGVLAAGPYGTGKTLLAHAVFQVATVNGWTALYLRNSWDLPTAIRFAERYAPCVVFAEDLDRVVGGQERNSDVDRILNTLDGIDTKAHEVLTILTTNHLDQVNKAVLRPGRLDVVIHVTPPDGEAIQRLMRNYGRGRIAENADLREVGDVLAGREFTAAVVREVVERAKLATINRTGDANAVVLAADLLVSAQAMVNQQELLAPKGVEREAPLRAFVQEFDREMKDLHHDEMRHTLKTTLSPRALKD